MSDVFVFFFRQETAYELRISDWSSDVCSSDLLSASGPPPHGFATGRIGNGRFPKPISGSLAVRTRKKEGRRGGRPFSPPLSENQNFTVPVMKPWSGLTSQAMSVPSERSADVGAPVTRLK